ncbi:MAG: NADH-quinone oxidoreductase subunit J [Dehalococcoidales bacterium]
MGLEIAFWVLATVTIVAALGMVMLRDIFRAALMLVLCFFTVAGIFVTLSADFLAAVQILIYIGAISVLIILAIMLTREVTRGNLFNKLRWPALFITTIFLGVTSLALTSTEWSLSSSPPQEPTTAALATKLFSESFVLPVEMSALLLLAAILGAIIMVREK